MFLTLLFCGNVCWGEVVCGFICCVCHMNFAVLHTLLKCASFLHRLHWTFLAGQTCKCSIENCTPQRRQGFGVIAGL